MPASQESLDIRKAMAYDLLSVIEASDKKEFSTEEIEAIINAYIAGLSQQKVE